MTRDEGHDGKQQREKAWPRGRCGFNGKCSATGPYLVVHKLQGEGRLAHAATAHHDYLVENHGRLVLVLTGGHGFGLQTKGWRWEGEAHTSVFRLISQWELSTTVIT